MDEADLLFNVGIAKMLAGRIKTISHLLVVVS